MKLFNIVVLLSVFSLSLIAQDSYDLSTSNQKSAFFQNQFSDYILINDNISDFKTFVDNKDQTEKFRLSIGAVDIDLVLFPYDIRSDNYQAVIQTQHGQKILEKGEVTTYRGYVDDRNKGTVRMTINDGFMYGFMETADDTYYFEPARYFTNNPSDNDIILYTEHALKTPGHATCGTHSSGHNEALAQPSSIKSAGQCFINDLAIATDYTMYIDPAHNSVTQLLNHTLGVSNNVSANYELNGSNNFSDGLEIEVGAHFISTCATCDPWSNTLDFVAFLNEFGNWARGDGFLIPFDMGQIWTDRNFAGPAVGLASQSGNLLCTNDAYHVLQDWTTNAPLLRAMTAHEIGHNLNGGHDGGSGFLMSSVVSNTNTWSPTAKATIGGQITMQGNNCLDSCMPLGCGSLQNVEIDNVTGTDFTLSWDATTAAKYLVKVIDLSTGTEVINMSTTNTTVALAPAGYAVCKRYEVILYNDCTSELSGSQQVRLISPTGQGCAAFKASSQVAHTGFPIQFSDESINATSWSWDFGDGTTSTLQNPVHSFSTTGDFNIQLTINQGVHTLVKNSFLKILPDLPTPYTPADGGDFESNLDHFSAFAIEGEDPLWEVGIAGNALTSTDNVWKTKLNEDIGRRESEVVLLTPKFDFQSPGVYVLEFDMSMEILFCNGPIGVKMEYSIDNGQTWTRLGSYGDSGPDIVGWYDRGPGDFCPLATQVFTDQTGWGFNGNNQHKSYDVSFLAGNAGVVFRYKMNMSSIFSSGYEVDGVSIDNFEIKAAKSALPLDLLSFEAELIDDEAYLTWNTASEINVDAYEVERLERGGDFYTIGSVSANNEDYNHYDLVDDSDLDPINYYRLKMIDLDGSYRYSKTISLKSNTDLSNNIQIFPNPVRDGLLNILANNIEVVDIDLFDIAGRQVKASINFFKESKTIDINNLQSGVYVLTVITEAGEKITNKFSKI